MALKKAILLDRDGTLNVDHGYVGRVEQLEWIQGVFVALKSLVDVGYDLYIVSNQSGLARSKYTWADLLDLERQMQRDLALHEIPIRSWIYCPHLTEINGACLCRKPHTGLLQRALSQDHYDLAGSWMVGDSPRDLEAGLALGLNVAGVQSGQKPMDLAESIVFKDILDFSQHILRLANK